MSYDIELLDPVTRECIELDEPHHMRGGTYCVGGEARARLNVTYNYRPIFARVLPALANGKYPPGIRTLYGQTGAEAIPRLEAAIAQLANDAETDYWAATEGNAKRALCQLLALARMRPDGIFDGD